MVDHSETTSIHLSQQFVVKSPSCLDMFGSSKFCAHGMFLCKCWSPKWHALHYDWICFALHKGKSWTRTSCEILQKSQWRNFHGFPWLFRAQPRPAVAPFLSTAQSAAPRGRRSRRAARPAQRCAAGGPPRWGRRGRRVGRDKPGRKECNR